MILFLKKIKQWQQWLNIFQSTFTKFLYSLYQWLLFAQVH